MKFALALFLALGGLPAAAQVEAFRYDAARVPVGKVYHYLKTNVDGTHPEHVSIRVAAPDRIESFKFHPASPPAGLVIADMDWSVFSVRKIDSWQVEADGQRKLAATLTALDGGKQVRVELPMLGKPAETVEIGRLPWHIYNFDLASLGFAFRHLVDPRGRFTIGIADPSFAEGPAFLYRGEAEVAYVGEETRNGVLCRKYRIDGLGLNHRGGFLWVNQAEGHVEGAEIDLPDNPAWQSFKFKLTGVESMDEAAWESFQKKQLQP
jgi:hypothetical protein